MVNLKALTYNDILTIEKEFKNGGNLEDTLGYKIIQGDINSKILISCPHSVSQVRDSEFKKRELFLGPIAIYLQKLTGCHLIYKTRNLNDDANRSSEILYRTALKEYVIDNDIQLVIDLHGSLGTLMDIEIGTYHGYNIGNNKTIIKNLYNVLIDDDITSIRCDKINFAGRGTIANFIKTETGVNAIQIEIGKKFRWPRTRLESFKKIIISLNKFIMSFDYAGAKEQIENRNYYLDYDNVLDIKPSYGYEREIGVVPKEYIGMELEIGINYEREMYTFIKKLLKKIKNIVGDNGYFVHDFTIISDYSLEIVFDPMPIDKLVSIYADIKEVIKQSSNQLFSNKNNNCGIHLNFNKKDVDSLEEVHQNLTNLMFNYQQYFCYNLYKKSKFKLSYKEYLAFQKKTGSKYVAINYRSKKLIEVRNISPNIEANELKTVSEKILNALYGLEFSEIEDDSINFINIYESALKKLKQSDIKKIKENNYIIINNIDSRPKIIDIDELNGVKNGK